jgi:hypothetical protein
LPAAEHEKGATIKEAGWLPMQMEKFLMEVKGRDLIFDETGKFIRADYFKFIELGRMFT